MLLSGGYVRWGFELTNRIMDKKQVERKSWDEFRTTGLVLIINQVLHVFGWALVFEVNKEGEVEKCYPARVTFRGFDNKDTDDAYEKVTEYMKNNSNELHEEIK